MLRFGRKSGNPTSWAISALIWIAPPLVILLLLVWIVLPQDVPPPVPPPAPLVITELPAPPSKPRKKVVRRKPRTPPAEAKTGPIERKPDPPPNRVVEQLKPVETALPSPVFNPEPEPLTTTSRMAKPARPTRALPHLPQNFRGSFHGRFITYVLVIDEDGDVRIVSFSTDANVPSGLVEFVTARVRKLPWHPAESESGTPMTSTVVYRVPL